LKRTFERPYATGCTRANKQAANYETHFLKKTPDLCGLWPVQYSLKSGRLNSKFYVDGSAVKIPDRMIKGLVRDTSYLCLKLR